jgi:hypothetical protein
MKARTWLCGMGMALVVCSSGGALVACGGGAGAKFASIKAGEMPSGESWGGVYYNPVYGYLHMTGDSENVSGRWKRTNGSKWGELSGTVDGNVLRFTWTEHSYGAIGPSGSSHGSGVFVYKVGAEEKAPPELDGQYMLDDSPDVGQWHCVKQIGMKVDINSINGDNPADTAPATQDKWN